MIIIGEKLNSSIPSTFELMKQSDTEGIIRLIQQQAEAGAAYLDVNTALLEEQELDRMHWIIELIKEHSDCGIMIDSTDPKIVEPALEAAKGREIIINSTTITDRFDDVVPLALQAGASVVALPIDDEGMPHSLADKCKKADILIEKLRAAGIEDSKIFLDVLIETLATDTGSAKASLGVIAYIAEKYPEVKTTCGMSNISFGLPQRSYINMAFLSAAVIAGLSSAIMNPVSEQMRKILGAANAVGGNDYYCMEYITLIRSMEENQA